MYVHRCVLCKSHTLARHRYTRSQFRGYDQQSSGVTPSTGSLRPSFIVGSTGDAVCPAKACCVGDFSNHDWLIFLLANEPKLIFQIGYCLWLWTTIHQDKVLHAPRTLCCVATRSVECQVNISGQGITWAVPSFFF